MKLITRLVLMANQHQEPCRVITKGWTAKPTCVLYQFVMSVLSFVTDSIVIGSPNTNQRLRLWCMGFGSDRGSASRVPRTWHC